MTRAEIDATVALFVAAGRRNIPVPLSEWRTLQMATAIGRVEKKAMAKGKIKPVDKTPKPLRGGKKKKADRLENGLRKNREAKR